MMKLLSRKTQPCRCVVGCVHVLNMQVQAINYPLQIQTHRKDNNVPGLVNCSLQTHCLCTYLNSYVPPTHSHTAQRLDQAELDAFIPEHHPSLSFPGVSPSDIHTLFQSAQHMCGTEGTGTASERSMVSHECH